MVPSQLMTEVTPSSSYTLPLAPNPVSLGGGLQPKDLHAATTAAATVPRPPRKLRRFHRPLIPIYKLLRLVAGYRRDIQLIPSSERPGTPATETVVRARATMREVGPEDSVPPIVVIQVGEMPQLAEGYCPCCRRLRPAS